jgi:DNA primase
VWSTIDAGNLSDWPVLNGIESLTIFADNDDAGIGAARACASRLREAGREVRIRTPLKAGHDINDIARSAHAAA